MVEEIIEEKNYPKLIIVTFNKKSNILFLKINVHSVIYFRRLFAKGATGSYMCVFAPRNILEGFKYSECCTLASISYMHSYITLNKKEIDFKFIF